MIKLYFEHFVDKDPARGQELFDCFTENLRNPHLYQVIPLRGDSRLTMGKALDLVRERAGLEDISILSNSDIAFDETVQLLERYDFKDSVLCLSRWEDGAAVISNDSQDAWVFKGIPKPVVADFYFGIPGCDNRFAYELAAAGYDLKNPCLSVRAHHRHASGVRHYDGNTPRLVGPIARVEPGTL